MHEVPAATLADTTSVDAVLAEVRRRMAVLQQTQAISLNFKHNPNIVLFRQLVMISCKALRGNFMEVCSLPCVGLFGRHVESQFPVPLQQA
jgi:hypothetical protein